MKSKKLLAQIAAFSLVFGMTGVVSSWADDIVLGGKPETNNETGLVKNEDGSFTVKDKDVKGVWLQNGSKLTANDVNFINGGDRFSEISVDNKSILTVNRGSIDSAQDAFNVNDGSKAEVNNAKVTTGAWANNAAITLKNSTTSGNWLYAGNAFPENEDDKGPVKEGLPVGSITIDGGTASVKNVLVQNKGQFNVTNGAVLDVTKDTSATDSAWEQPATGITKGGEIVVRAWGPNTAQAEKENSDTDPVNKLDQVSTLAVNGATVKANKLTVEGKEAKKLNYSESAAFTAKNNSTVVLDSAVLNRAKFYAENSQISIGDLHADNSQFLANNGTKAEIQKMTMDNGSVLGVGSYGKVADVTVHQLDMKGNSTIAFENGQLNSDQITMDKSTIDIAGVGTLIANKMTLNNATLSLSGIQNNMDTRALIQPVDVTQNGVTVEVKDTLAMNGGKLQVNDGSNLTTNQMKLTNGSMVTVDGTNSSFTIKGTDNTVSGGSKIELNGDAKLNLKDLTLQDGGELYANWRSTVNADTISVEDGAKFQGVGRSTINVNNLRIGSNPGRIRVRGTFEGRVTDLNGKSLSKQQVKESFLLPTGDKTSLEFQDPEVDHTLVLHMNADGGLTMQGKDFSQADTGNTRTYIMASWSANGDYNAEGHNIKNVNSLSAKRLVINGTDITDSLGGAVDVSGKADTSYVDGALDKKANAADVYTKTDTDKKIEDSLTDVNKAVAGKADKSYVDAAVKKATEGVATDANVANKADKDLGNLSEAGKNVIKETMEDDLAVKADKTYVDGALGTKADKKDLSDLGDKVDGKADKSYVDAAVKEATEGIATNANVANKADKDLRNLSEEGKNVIKETMKDDLAVKADKTYVDGTLGTKADKKDLSDLSAKVDVKADKTYVDGALGTKADKKDLSDLSDKVDVKADKTYVDGALGTKADKKDLSDLSAKVDGKADKDASNIDAAAYTKILNTGKVEDGNTSLVSGGAVWNAIKDVKNNTGAGWVKVNGDTVAIASDAGATKVSVAGLKGDRVLTGVKTDEKDASSAANVGYVNSTAISLTDSMNAMNSKLSDDIKNAGAVGAALAGLHHLDYDPDNKLDVAVAAGNYRGKSATAMGLFYQPNEMMMVSAGATIGADDNAYNVGLSFKVGKGQTGLTTSKAAMSQEIKELKAAKKESDQKMAAQDEEIRALKEQVAMLVKEMKLSNTVEKDMKK